jgi:ribokinase
VHRVGHDRAVSVDQEPASGARAARVLVVGDANPDLVLSGDVVPRFVQVEQLLDAASLVIGGSASITAHGLARLGRRVSLAAAVGDDHFGTFLTRLLDEAGVDVRHVAVRPDLPTGLTVALNRGPDRAMLTLTGAIDSLTESDLHHALDDLHGQEPSRRLGHVHVASLYLQPSLAPALPSFLGRARELGLTTSMDTNGDPSERWLGIDDLLPHLDVLLPNRDEAVALGRDADPRQAAVALASQGPLTVVKDGGAGAFAVSPDGHLVEAPGSPVDPVDTTGAGDTFDAAFLDAWLDGLPLHAVLRRAVVAGTFCVRHIGGTAGQPTQDQITEALDEPAPLTEESSA